MFKVVTKYFANRMCARWKPRRIIFDFFKRAKLTTTTEKFQIERKNIIFKPKIGSVEKKQLRTNLKWIWRFRYMSHYVSFLMSNNVLLYSKRFVTELFVFCCLSVYSIIQSRSCMLSTQTVLYDPIKWIHKQNKK